MLAIQPTVTQQLEISIVDGQRWHEISCDCFQDGVIKTEINVAQLGSYSV